MACTDGGVPYPPTREELLDAKVPTPMLCAIMRVLSLPERKSLLTAIDWEEAGITRAEFEEWWATHKRRDEELNTAAKRKALREQALAKLTPAERRALGWSKEGKFISPTRRSD